MELVDISKAFGPTVALRNVSMQLHGGEVLALVGENGAGKSTLVNVLGGVFRPDTGKVLVSGQSIELHSAIEAGRHGITVVHQHPALFPDLSIAENVYADSPITTGTGRVDHGAMERATAMWLTRLGLRSSPSTPVRELSTPERLLVEIARALVSRSRVLILDEPTSSLPADEVDRLFAIVDELRKEGVAILFVSHRLDEIFRISDKIAILRDGHLVGCHIASSLTPAQAVQQMIGRSLSSLYPDRRSQKGRPILEVARLSKTGRFSDVTLTVRTGEVFGLAGLVGSGRTDVARVLFGIERPSAGTVVIDGKRVEMRSPRDAMDRGVAYLSEDRRGQSLIEEFSILANTTLPVVDNVTRFGLVSRTRELRAVKQFLELMRLRYRSYDQPVAELSGGNQQKVALAKWLATKPRILILDEPTQGIDVQTKAEVHRLIASLAESGLAILLISSDLPELLGMCDRIAVVREGRMVAEFDGSTATEQDVMLAATGIAETQTFPNAAHRPFQPAQWPKSAIRSDASRGLRPLSWLARRREVGLVVVLLVLAFIATALDRRFIGWENQSSIVVDAALLLLVVVGETIVILSRNIDLSVASVLALAAFVSAQFMHNNPSVSVVGGVAVASGVGLACGLFNGLVVGYGRVPAIIVTLGTLYVYRGLDAFVSKGIEITAPEVPQAWLSLTATSVAGTSSVVWIALACLGLTAYFLRWTTWGRQLFAIGSNPDAARLIGLPVKRRLVMAFTFSGLLAGFAGALWASHYATVDTQYAYGQELTVIASVVVGGVAIFGGSGSVVGAALGTLLLLEIKNGLILAHVDTLSITALYGFVILAAVAIDLFVRRLPATGRRRLV